MNSMRPFVPPWGLEATVVVVTGRAVVVVRGTVVVVRGEVVVVAGVVVVVACTDGGIVVVTRMTGDVVVVVAVDARCQLRWRVPLAVAPEAEVDADGAHDTTTTEMLSSAAADALRI